MKLNYALLMLLFIPVMVVMMFSLPILIIAYFVLVLGTFYNCLTAKYLLGIDLTVKDMTYLSFGWPNMLAHTVFNYDKIKEIKMRDLNNLSGSLKE